MYGYGAKKILRHDGCGGKVSKKTLICKKCGIKPSGNDITLVYVIRTRSQRSMRYENLLGTEGSLFGYPRQ